MRKRSLAVLAVAAVLSLPTSSAWAAGQNRAEQGDQTQQQSRIYGSQLMTPQERAEYRARMRAAKTAEERERIRNEHHEQIKQRAKARGRTLPDQPPARGRGMGRRGGMGRGNGNGMEPGGGMGSGGGMGPGGGMGSGGGPRGR